MSCADWGIHLTGGTEVGSSPRRRSRPAAPGPGAPARSAGDAASPTRSGRADLQGPLQAQRRDAVLARGEQPAGGEPYRERCARAVKDGARRHRGTAAAARAHEAAIGEPPAPSVTAARADEAGRPAQPLQVVEAVRIASEPSLELAHGLRIVPAGTRMLHCLSLHRLNGYPRADKWRVSFGHHFITGAVVAGVFDLKCLQRAQDEHQVALFWQHDLTRLADFVVAAK